MYVFYLPLKLKVYFEDSIFEWGHDLGIFTIIVSLISGQRDGLRKR